MWDSFFIYVAFNLMIFGAVIMSYGLFTESKKNPDSKKFHLFGSLFFLSMWLLVIWMQFWGGLGESGSITIITQFTLISILIFDIKINEHRILNFFGKFVDMFNNTIEVTLPRLFRNVLLYSTIILAFPSILKCM